MAHFSNKERWVLTVVLMGVFCLVAFDLWHDWEWGASGAHLASEGTVAFIALVGVAYLWIQKISLSQQLKNRNRDLETARAEAQKWKTENAHYIRGLGEAIEKQLQGWQLSPAETEIALFLLKGLSLKEIADFRKTSERTVRQQTITLYRKSGLAGRSELSAYFLEDLLAPTHSKPEGA